VTRGGPLAGVKVIELGGIGPGPHAGMVLADLGADVVRVRRPGGLTMPAEDRDLLHRGKRIVDLDVKAQPQTLLELAAKADVLLDCFRPGTCERLGIGPDDCAAVNPRLIFARITGWGQDGPLAPTAGHDINYLSQTGDEWARVFAGTDACVTPVLTWSEAATNDHLNARSTVITAHGVEQAAPAPRFSRTPAGPVGPPPATTTPIAEIGW
jgi:crotonobetainyl-CoA:carnitine CoA-transferase CaiB-like acyl-CoA transferase